MTELPVSASYKLVLETTDILYDYSDTKILHTITAPLHAANTLAHSLLRDEIAGLGNYPTEPVEETVDKRTGGVTLTTSGGPNTSLDFVLKVVPKTPDDDDEDYEGRGDIIYTVVLTRQDGMEVVGCYRDCKKAVERARERLRKECGVKGWRERRALKGSYKEGESAEGGNWEGEWRGEGWKVGSSTWGRGWVRVVVRRTELL